MVDHYLRMPYILFAIAASCKDDNCDHVIGLQTLIYYRIDCLLSEVSGELHTLYWGGFPGRGLNLVP